RERDAEAGQDDVGAEGDRHLPASRQERGRVARRREQVQPSNAHRTSAKHTSSAATTIAVSTTGFLRRWWNGLRPIATSIVPPMESLQVERSRGVVTITIDRPEKKNALTRANWEQLRDLCREIAANTREDRCVVITGAGGEFCAGQDLGGEGDG